MLLEEAIRQVNEELSVLKEKKKIIIWGTGEASVRLYQYTDIGQYLIWNIVDNYKAGTAFFGKTVKNPHEIAWEETDAVVVAAAGRGSQIGDELKNVYHYKGLILWIKPDSQGKMFYEHLQKSEWEVPAEYQNIIEQNKKFENIHKNERIFIICNGPSLNKMDLRKLRDEKKMVVSNFYMHKDFDVIRPDYYCLAQFTYTDIFTEEVGLQLIEEIASHGSDIQYFFNISEKKLVDQSHGFENAKVNYMYLDGIAKKYYETIDMTKKMVMGQSVSIDCIQVAMYMGFKEIYLIGTEHDSLITNKHAYFFKRKENIIGDKDIAINSDSEMLVPFGNQLDCMHNLWQDYRLLKKVADKNGIHIYNATIGGKLDVFERVDYNQLFEN